MKTLKVWTSLTIARPAARVYRAAARPVPFFLKRASAPMRAGRIVRWTIAGTPMTFPVTVRRGVPPRLLEFSWPSPTRPIGNRVRFEFRRLGPRHTVVTIGEAGFPATAAGRDEALRNVQGWMHFLCALKGWVEHGVNLRRASFLHLGMRDTSRQPVGRGAIASFAGMTSSR